MKCTNCNAELYSGDRFCGMCGHPISTPQTEEASESGIDLFPLYGVTLGKTTVQQLARLGVRTSSIDKNTGKPYQYYVVNGTNFWYNDSGIADHMYIARGIYPISEQWRALGFDWDISYNQWINLLQRLGYSTTIAESPRVVKYSGHDSFSAKIIATKQTIMIELGFDFSEGTTTDSKGTLYNIWVRVP
jgi:zinc ribbon protein